MRNSFSFGPVGASLPILTALPADGASGDVVYFDDGTVARGVYEFAGGAWRRIYGGASTSTASATVPGQDGEPGADGD
nr:hypothetical protein [Planctomycetota bacterium]